MPTLYTVVRAMNVFSGECHFSGSCSSETLRPIFKGARLCQRHDPACKFGGQSVQRRHMREVVAVTRLFFRLF